MQPCSSRCAERILFADHSHEVHSHLSSRVTVGGVCVDVQIFRLNFYHLWALEVVTGRGGSMVWDELFETDEEALAAFEAGAEKLGVAVFLANEHWEICRGDAGESASAARSQTPNDKDLDRLSGQPELSVELPDVQCAIPK
jgi:hypothetical protein